MIVSATQITPNGYKYCVTRSNPPDTGIYHQLVQILILKKKEIIIVTLSVG